jgi:hypothetical protein
VGIRFPSIDHQAELGSVVRRSLIPGVGCD